MEPASSTLPEELSAVAARVEEGVTDASVSEIDVERNAARIELQEEPAGAVERVLEPAGWILTPNFSLAIQVAAGHACENPRTFMGL
jgi:hypothetical protein